MTTAAALALRADRATIRARAASLGCRYRITASGEVHYYGRMPSSSTLGWYWVAYSASEAAADIRFEDEYIGRMTA